MDQHHSRGEVMDKLEDHLPNSWTYFAPRPTSTLSYGTGGHSTSVSPSHATPLMSAYPSPHGAFSAQVSERQRSAYELTHYNRQQVAARLHFNGPNPPPSFTNRGTPPPPYYHQPTPPLSVHAQNVPHLPPLDGLNEKQRQARDLIINLDGDKKLLLGCRKQTAAELKKLKEQLEELEASQKSMENLRFIYPLQAQIGDVQRVHDAYGREWVNVEELLEICWTELMVPNG
ncbi:MAG: hypothetical protein Q9220_005942 [cf. Caloplaca sp. 1 TL-2023]